MYKIKYYESVLNNSNEIIKDLKNKHHLSWSSWNKYEKDGGEQIGSMMEVNFNNDNAIWYLITNAFLNCFDKYCLEFDLNKEEYELTQQYRIASWGMKGFSMMPHSDTIICKSTEIEPDFTMLMYFSDDYFGAELGISKSDKIIRDDDFRIKPKAGSIVIFPSNTLHYVLPFESGNRYTTQIFAINKKRSKNEF